MTTTADDIKAGGPEGLAALRLLLADEVDSEHRRAYCHTCSRTASATPALAARLLAIHAELDERSMEYEPAADPVFLAETGPMPEVRSVADGFRHGGAEGLAALRDLIATELGVSHVHGYCRTCKRTSSNTPTLAARLVDVRAAIDAMPPPPDQEGPTAALIRRFQEKRARQVADNPLHYLNTGGGWGDDHE
jgi:hypothetical protein